MKPYFNHSLIKYSRQDPKVYISKYHDLDNILLHYVTLKCWEHVIKIMNAVHLLLLKWEQAGVFFPRWYHETWRDCFDGKTQVINFLWFWKNQLVFA